MNATYAALKKLESLAFLAILLLLLCGVEEAQAKPEIRDAFFSVYPTAVGTQLDNLPSRSGHCGVCHWRFQGGGTRNPYGVTVQNALASYPTTAAGLSNAIYSLRSQDPDGDGFSNDTEVTNRISYSNTPTFPGLTPGNVSQITGITLSDVHPYLVPATAVDKTPPTITVLAPNGGESLVANSNTTVRWTAADASGIAAISIFLSLDNGTSYQPLALNLTNSGSYVWFPANRPSSNALLRLVAIDNASNTNADQSDTVFRIVPPPGGRVPTTLRDFDMPGTQPLEGGLALDPPTSCASCHGNYNPATEPYFNWRGSMMANASLDPLFRANLTLANQDAPDSGDLCLRCHMYRGWVQGRSTPTDGRLMQSADLIGVACDLCHRMVDPMSSPANPTNDLSILAALSKPTTNFGNGMVVLDPNATRRGPFSNAISPHEFLISPFHREAALCGTCHDVSNPAFQRNEQGQYVANALNTPAANFSPHSMAPVERTYSEWFFSAFNSSNGVFAPAFAGNRADGRVSTCQDCHMRAVSGYGCNPATQPGVALRTNLPLHDMTGGSTWLPALMTNLYPTEMDAAATQAGIGRAASMLTNAASLALIHSPSQLTVVITNNTGHKLPTGYPEGRRMWINVKFYNENTNLLAESGAYDLSTGVLSHEAGDKVYEVKPGLDSSLAALIGLQEGPSFHFVLNNKTFKDNRIPPQGFINSVYESVGAAPAGYTYGDNQYWDETLYTLPPGATRAEVRLYYQSTSKEFVEFLRDENVTDQSGQEMYNLWNANGKCPPTLMAQAEWSEVFVLKQARMTSRGIYRIDFLSRPGTVYEIQYADELGTPVQWHSFAGNGSLTANGTQSYFEDDFTANTSGASSSTGMRFYRIGYRP